jgi:hypothetical protein
MTYGQGNIGNRSIEGLVLDFAGTPEADVDTVEETARNLFDHVQMFYGTEFAETPVEQRPIIGFFVAGYSQEEPFTEEFEFVLPRDDEPSPVRGAEEFGASWRGVDAPFTRLTRGFDPYVIPARLGEAGLNEEAVNRVLDADGLQTFFVLEGMPVQDAINFAVFLLETTIGWSTFAAGVALCGGPLQVAVILPDTGFTWVARPELSIGGADLKGAA